MTTKYAEAKLCFFVLFAVLASAATAGQKLSGTTAAIVRNAVTGGGELKNGPVFIANCAVAEAGVGTFTGAGLKLYSGLFHQLAQPGSVIAMTAVTKTTGTLELSWTAPGLDGALGDVVLGFYRLDWSSETAHAFAPTVFQTEFSTSVIPGTSQSFTAAGLEPNTTYFVRVYLADDRKFLAETSHQASESTLANLPVTPVLTGVFKTSVTFSWTLPVGAAESFGIDASSTNFGALFPGGTVISTRSADGLTVSMALTGLLFETTYYIRLASLNWQSDLNFTGITTAETLQSGMPRMVLNLVLTPDVAGRRVLLTWTNQVFENPNGVIVIASTNPITASVVDGTVYGDGFVFPDQSVVKASSANVSHLETGLVLDTTQYFALYSHNTAAIYSTATVSAQIVIDLPAMAPAGLSVALSVDGASVTFNWSGTFSNNDGSPFKIPTAPTSWELNHFEIWRATGIVRSNWVYVGSAPVTALSYQTPLPVPGQVYYYKITTNDLFPLGGIDDCMSVDTLGNLYAVGPDGASRLKIPASLAGTVLASGNKTGQPLLVRAREQPADIGGKVLKSMRFAAVQSPSNATAEPLLFSGPQIETFLHYDVAGGVVMPSALSSFDPSAAAPFVLASDAATRLGVFWDTGRDFVKLFGRVDTVDQTAMVQSAMSGNFQIRALVRDTGFSFDISGISNKALTPNGDGLNDTVVFVFDNPRASAFSGKIYDLRGAFVAEMRTGPVSGSSLLWDGKSSGNVVPQGAYIYKIAAENKTFTGTVVVIR